LLAWYERHARILPWRVGPGERQRGVRPDPYLVLLSEIMLQQTTVRAVAPFFDRFRRRWPTLADLAVAPEADVMAAWAGLGYYSRARNLLAAARVVANRQGSGLPESAAELAKLPGIGAYTSAAVAAIAFGERIAVMDGNVERVMARLHGIGAPLPAAKPLLHAALDPLVPADRPGEFAEALMDLGATICTPRRPPCALCPWSDPCVARREGRQDELPAKVVKRERPKRHGRAFVARRADGAILLRRRPPRGLLGGMSEVPGSAWSEDGEEFVAAPIIADWRKAGAIIHIFTHFELTLSVQRAEIAIDVPPPPGHWWSPPAALPQEALPNVMKKAIEAAYPGATRPLGERE
jgi:A/G-specific adenine glycosylase